MEVPEVYLQGSEYTTYSNSKYLYHCSWWWWWWPQHLYGDATPGDASNTTITYPGPYTWTANRGGHGGGYSTIALTTWWFRWWWSYCLPPLQVEHQLKVLQQPPLGTLTGYGNAGSPDAPAKLLKVQVVVVPVL